MANTKYVNTKSQTIIKKNYSNQHLLVSTEKKPVIKNSNENLNFKKKIPKGTFFLLLLFYLINLLNS